MRPNYTHALIIGAGSGLSASLARRFQAEGLRITLASRTVEDLGPLCQETGATAHPLDASDAGAVAALFETLDTTGAPDVVVYNPSARVRGPIQELDPEAVRKALEITGYGGFIAAREAAKRMIPARHGALLFTGASAGVKGFANSSVFAMGKFALRGLAQALARELHPQGIHVGHFVIDGGIRNPQRPERVEAAENPDSLLDPDAIAEAYWQFLAQDRSAWAWEIELRPWVERF
ncbi:MAG: SDR family NAD(P)-dependent oxidoreductase [Pseudomonadota bacterium]